MASCWADSDRECNLIACTKEEVFGVLGRYYCAPDGMIYRGVLDYRLELEAREYCKSIAAQLDREDREYYESIAAQLD